MLSKASYQWIETIFCCTEKLIWNRVSHVEKSLIQVELNALRDYILCSVAGWSSPVLTDFAVLVPITLQFFITDRAVAVMRDACRWYGTDLAGLTKVTQRIAGISYTRKISYKNDFEASSPKISPKKQPLALATLQCS